MPKVPAVSHDKNEIRDLLLADLSLRPDQIQAPDPTVVPHRSVNFFIGYLQELSADCLKFTAGRKLKRYPLRPRPAPDERSSTEILKQLLRQLNTCDNELFAEFLQPSHELLRIFADIIARFFHVLKQLAVVPHENSHYADYDRTREGLREREQTSSSVQADAAGRLANSNLLELVISRLGRHETTLRSPAKSKSQLLIRTSQSHTSPAPDSFPAGVPDTSGRASLNDLLNVQRAILHHAMPAGVSPYESSYRLPKFGSVSASPKEPLFLTDLSLLLLCVHEIARRPVRVCSHRLVFSVPSS